MVAHDPIAEADLMPGIYKYGLTRVIALSGVSDCSGSTVSCPYFSRIKIDSMGKYTVDSYAYYPVQKIWVALSASDNLTIGAGDLNGSSAGWTSNNFSLTAANTAIQNNRRTYSYGSALFQLAVGSSNISGNAISGGAVFPVGSKQYTVAIELLSGKFVSLKKGGFWASANSTDDAKAYASLANLRAAHTTNATRLCMDGALDVASNVVFNSTSYGGIISADGSICSSASTGIQTVVSEGVATVAGRPLILLSQPASAASGSNTSDKQFVLAIGLTDAGVVARGKSYLPGYIQSVAGYVNEAALNAWIKTQSSDSAALLYPK
jgi:hypothetical protein